MVLQSIGPSSSTPVRPICDLRVLDHFILEALDTQKAVRGCQAGCSVTGSFAVPSTNVDFVVWESKDERAQVEEVWSGLSLLSQALSAVSSSISSPDLQDLLANNRRNIQSVGQVLRSLHFQDLSAPASSDLRPLRLLSLSELLSIHINFLRGKVRLLLTNTPACQQTAS